MLNIANHSGVVHFAGLDRDNLQPWIVRRAKELGANIEPSAAALLGRLVGSDLRTLNNEIEKLTLYVAGQRPIQKADVDLLVSYTDEAEKFGMSNAIDRRDARRAYDQLRKELDEGKNPMAILGGIAAQIRALIEVKDMAQRGLRPAATSRRMSLPRPTSSGCAPDSPAREGCCPKHARGCFSADCSWRTSSARVWSGPRTPEAQAIRFPNFPSGLSFSSSGRIGSPESR